MRVIAGVYRSRILKSLAGNALRPTSDRLRETLFNVLGDAVNGSRFLDVFAGTGAIGIEALSRGASEVVFIENHGPAAKLIKRNLESLGIKSAAAILPLDAVRALEKLDAKIKSSSHGFDFIFVDPPYAASDDYSRVLRFLGASSLLAENCTVIAEHRRDFALPEKVGSLYRTRILKQGDAALSFYHGSNFPPNS
ncbi:MAG TPA: 16S rRNA (guanine(966)-N(2))-methyltransferase RsmD [Candidatus Acidoferrum sp.]|jgi:16S rRNA (guanine(966)-N(2))-methyltransferase RsmD